MSINIGPPASEELRPRITVIGVGGAGGNAIANMIEAQIEGVDFIVANTDAQALNTAVADNRIQLGREITSGLGAGARPEVGRAAAEETVEEIERALDGVNMVFIAAGMGGGTGTGAAPVIAETARRMGVLTVGVVTKPFLFEGTRRMRSAESGIDELQKHVDTLIVIPNQNLFLVAKAETTFKEAFQLADEVLQQGVRSITDLMVMPGLINLDFADVRSVMGEMGKAMMGTGEGEGENRALEAAERAIANPLLDGVSMAGAKGVIISIIGGDDMKLLEVDEAANHIRELVDEDANIIWGSAFNPDLQGRIRVSVVATGIEQEGEPAAMPTARTSNFGASRAPRRPTFGSDSGPSGGHDAGRGAGQSPTQGPTQGAMPSRSFAAPEQDDAPDAAAPSAPEPVAPTPSPSPAPVPQTFSPPPGARQEFGAPQRAAPTPAYGDDDDDGDDDAFDLTEEAGDTDTGAGMGTTDAAEMATPVPARRSAGSGDQDDLLGDASRLTEEDSPLLQKPAGRRRGLTAATDTSVPGKSGSGGSGEGSTLFERMANLSRGSRRQDDEDDDEDGGAALNIPRFLNRTNNQ